MNPERDSDEAALQVHGLTREFLLDKPKFSEIAKDFLGFIDNAELIIHNAPFDIRFLNHEIGKIYDGYRVANPHLCTVQLSRRLVPNIENHKLNTVAEHFRVNLENHHRASHDAHATAKIFVNLLEQLNDLGVSDLAAARKVKI